MTRITLNPMIKTLYFCADDQRFAVLKVLERMKSAKYINIKKIVAPDKPSQRFGHHVRMLRKMGVIQNDPRSSYYSLTRVGKHVIKLIENYMEKYMEADPTRICKNDSDLEHSFVTICRKCGVVRK